MLAPRTEVILTKAGVELARQIVDPGEYVIGRGDGAAILVDAEGVADRHAQLTVNYSDLLIEDLGSDSGTLVNGKPVQEATRLWPNQKVQLGPVVLETRRIKPAGDTDYTLSPQEETVRRALPESFLREQKYEIGGVFAQGGMGAILDAKEATTERTVAMKVMLQASSPEDTLRFIGEAKVTAQLEHPSIVPVYELSVDEHDNVFYTMKLVRGITLRKVLEQLAAGDAETLRRYPLATLLTVFQKVCDAVAFAHSKRVLHRDLKPENIMIGDFGEVLVMDWGLAKILGEPAAVDPAAALRTMVHTTTRDLSASATMAGTVIGTPQYMSPEQARGEVERLDARSDVYALGAILFHILELRPPVEGDDPWVVVRRVAAGEKVSLHLTRKQPHLPGGRVPDSLAAVVQKAMAPDRESRYGSVEALQADLTAYQNGFATRAERAGLVKQTALLVRRNKGAFVTAFAAWLLLTGLAVWFVVDVTHERNRVQSALADVTHERNRAEKALTDLKGQAPALRQLAESEAGYQRFDSALEKLDAALALDAAHPPSYWRRAWFLIGAGKYAEAVSALQFARQHDPANSKLAAILPRVEQLAAAAREHQEPGTAVIKAVFDHLNEVGARSAALPLSHRIKLSAEQRRPLVQAQIEKAFGRHVNVGITPTGYLEVKFMNTRITSLEGLRGLPIDILDINYTYAESLEPLRGMRLVKLMANSNPIADLSPLQGMPLGEFEIYSTKVNDLSPLRGAPLERLNCEKLHIADFSPLRGLPLKFLWMSDTGATALDFLADAPIQELDAHGNPIVDLSPLRGKPLRMLNIANTKVTDLTPLRGLPIDELWVARNDGIKDYSPLLDLPKLERLRVSKVHTALEPLRHHPSLKFIGYYEVEAYQPVAEFWAAFDAWEAAHATAAALLPKRPVASSPAGAEDAGGWDDVLLQLTPTQVEKTGQGWTLQQGELFSPEGKRATLPLPGKLAGASYQVRVRLREFARKDVFHVVLPVADEMCGFELDGYSGKYSGLQLVDGKKGSEVPGIVAGKQVQDSEPHELEIGVRLEGGNATIAAMLDNQPLYTWNGPAARLSQNPAWATTEPGSLALGTAAGGWAVSELKVKRLDVK